MILAVPPNFDYSSNWGSGSSSSEAVAAEINSDNDTFSIAIKHTNNYGTESNTDWEILTVSNSGLLTGVKVSGLNQFKLMKKYLAKILIMMVVKD